MTAVVVGDFQITRPRHQRAQTAILEWLAVAHAEAEAAAKGLDRAQTAEFATRMRNVIARCAPGPDRIAARGTVLDEIGGARWDDDGAIYPLRRLPRGAGTEARMRRFAELAAEHLEATYPDGAAAPDDLVHVTCTGYVSPSAAQRLVARRGWRSRVTHAYHMGCYAALPATRLAAAMVIAGGRGARADVVHTELCSLHLDPSDHRLEQLVIQSLFADGMIRYTLREGDGPGLRLLAEHEVILPDSAASMTWIPGDAGMRMTLARDVPERIAARLPGFVADLLARAGVDGGAAARMVFAVHPGGPKIIDGVQDTLRLEPWQVNESRAVLSAYGNMSSATLPHIWARLVDDAAVASGTRVVALAFGPGLTICGAVLEKV